MIFKVSLFVVSHSESLNNSALTVPSNYLGTGHYLLPGGRRILAGITWFLGEQKGGSVVTENPKKGIIENFGRIQRGGPLKFVWEMKTWEDCESHQMLLGGNHFSEVTFTGGIR